MLIVIAINRLLTKQQLYFSRQFHWLDYAFCFVIILMAVPFLPTKDLTTSIVVGLMGGFSEEFLARGVLLGKLTGYFVRKKYSLGRIFAAIFWSNLIFALMHFTNLGQSGLNYVLLQSILAFISGLAFSVIYLQTGSLWYPIALHFMDDFMRTAHDTGATAGGQFGLWALAAMTWLKVGIFIYALVTWRKKKPALVRLVEQQDY
ncbi:CPBP family intramembrane glutamic endopeptidase [Fructobacillus cardui]|uniref:CPBP family intramembrane glutamic endopeptidase n=1 Tax=Fructobacillus cardui TaxID=2893170 RepID=UPI0030C81679